MHCLLNTDPDWVITLLRVVLGVVFFPHGAQKMLGWFGGRGLQQTLAGFKQYIGIPAPLGLLAVTAELFGSLGLIAGLLTRIAAFGVGFTMLVALLAVHARHGFFVNWQGDKKGHGIEFHLLAIAIAVAITVRGGGTFSLDAIFARMF
jgi:putative oxidoreductase